MNLRTLIEGLSFRSRLANIAGHTYGGLRNMYRTLGYQRELFVRDYRSRYRRNEIANRVVKALPHATWRGGAELWEDQDPAVDTPFEQAFIDLDDRLKLWDTFHRADILAGIGRYSVILIGAPGELDQPLESCKPEELVYLSPYSEEDATIEKYEIDIKSPRFGLPIYYTVKRTTMTSANAINSATVGRRVHWTRIFHMADGLLDDRLYGEPRLECIWNRLDDLEKVAGGGAEAFWRRADRGTQFDLDPTQDLDAEGQAAFEKQIQEYEHGMRRYLLTRGLTANQMGSDVADFNAPVLSIIGLICAGTGIPQRVLLGSEQGKLAAKMDRGNWDDRVSDRRIAWAAPMVVRPFIARLVELGVLPEPDEGYEVRFPELKILDDEQRSVVATEWADINMKMGETVVSADEIRTRVLGLPSRDEAGVVNTAPPPKGKQPKALQGKESARWQHIHTAADRFPGEAAESRRERFRRRQEVGLS